ncbi:ATPase domain-containing protein [Oleiharenicola lentus]|uniref:ATPase domain-containing protein n=1 Tax=Oleiharenicola lentus TaxID=2508720 RepID=UPI003F67BD66
MHTSPNPINRKKSSTGIDGLDEILQGGLPSNRFYLLRGQPGVGKTTLALQFLLAGEAIGEKGFYITLSETRDEIMAVAESHDWDLGELAIFELSALEQHLAQESQNTIFHPSELELNKTTEALLAEINRVKPARLVLDSLSELRLLSDTPFRYRRQMLALKQYFAGKQITVLLLDDHAGIGGGDLHVESIAHGVVTLEQIESDYGAERRRIKINKLRGVNFVGGYHDSIILQGGLQVFPRLIAADHRRDFDPEPLLSGVPGLDQLIGGGLDRGTSTLLLGPAGSGKSSITMQFAVAAAKRGEKVYIYLFEENLRTLLMRTKSINLPVQEYIDSGKIVLKQIDPAERTPGEFVHMVQQSVQKDNARVIVIDSLNGYLQAMPDAKFLTIQLHELLSFLNHHGVITLLTVAQHGLLGNMSSPVDLTYLADSVILLRYFEQGGAIRKAISVIKKRTGRHESTIREYLLEEKGLRVGVPLEEFHGVLTGVPTFKGKSGQILTD